MHDLDHTRPSYDSEMEYEAEFELEFEDEAEFEYESGNGSLTEEEVVDLAAELIAVADDDDELEYFLGSLVKKAASGAATLGRAAVGEAKRFARSPQGKALVSQAKGAARGLLKQAGGALGGYAGSRTGYGSGRGSRAGTDFGDFIADKIGLELEAAGVSDYEFEAAKRLVRVTADATAKALTSPSSGSPRAAAKRALATAVRASSNGSGRGSGGRSGNRSGRWVRRGTTIVLQGV